MGSGVYYTSALRLLALRELRAIRVSTQAFRPRVEEKLSRVSKFHDFIS